MTIDLSLLPDGGVGWLDASGKHADIVLSTRIRLARNVEGYAFTARARDGERLRVLSQVREAVTSLQELSDAVLYRLDELSPTDRHFVPVRWVNGNDTLVSGVAEDVVAVSIDIRLIADELTEL